MVRIKKTNIELLSYCGLYCGACPSYYRGTCLGCRSENHDQKRKSKWSCKIRECCLNDKEVLYCGECSEFPCANISKKLLESHPKDPRFFYRHEIPENIKQINEISISKWIKYQKRKWRCDDCGGKITFYDYKCMNCNRKSDPKYLNNKGGKNTK